MQKVLMHIKISRVYFLCIHLHIEFKYFLNKPAVVVLHNKHSKIFFALNYAILLDNAISAICVQLTIELYRIIRICFVISRLVFIISRCSFMTIYSRKCQSIQIAYYFLGNCTLAMCHPL